MTGFHRSHFDAALELKFVAETGCFEGYASVFAVTDSMNDRIEKGAFASSLAEHKARGQMPPLLWQHDVKQPIGAFTDIYEDAHGLFVQAKLFIDDIPRAKEAWKLMREGVVTGMSIGYKTRQSHRDAKTSERILTDIELLEVSMVTFPANAHARVSGIKSQLVAGHVPEPKEFEAFLRDAGFSRKQAKGLMSAGYKSLLLRDAGEGADTETEMLYALSAKIKSLTV